MNYIAKSVKISTADWVLSLKKIFFWVQNIVIECAIESINWDWDERIIVWGKWNIELKNKLRNEDYIDNRNRALDPLKDHLPKISALRKQKWFHPIAKSKVFR